MKVYAISDLHLSTSVEKPMNIFGDGWDNHFDKISADWTSKVNSSDIVLLGGDISWGLTIDQAASDYALLSALPGLKVIGKGNHDYYWNSLEKMRARFKDFYFLQNNAYRIEADGTVTSLAVNARRKQDLPLAAAPAIVIAGSRGWAIPTQDSEEADIKIYRHELLRLEFSLSSAKALMREGDKLIALLHYPPFNVDYADTEVTDLIEKYGVSKVVYGHLHGKSARVTPVIKKQGIEYILTSCDLVGFTMTEIFEL